MMLGDVLDKWNGLGPNGRDIDVSVKLMDAGLEWGFWGLISEHSRD